MRVALFSDVHSNFFALNAVIKDMSLREIDQYICLGDIVGYAAQPAECIKMIRDLKADVIMGNHDLYATNDESLSWFNSIALAGLEYSRKALSKSDKQWLASQPLVRRYPDFTVVHATLDQPDEWEYITSINMAKHHFKLQDQFLCFIGHTHQVKIFQQTGDQVKLIRGSAKTRLNKKFRYLINVGSVGQPRDHNPDSSYVVYDTEKNVVEFYRIEYPVEEAMQSIVDAGLPPYLGLRLNTGE